MSHMIILQVLVLLILIFVVYFRKRRYRVWKFGRSLPMPRGLPLIGNILQLGSTPWIPMKEWSEEFGPIYALNLGGKTAVVLNSYKVASEILDKRSAIYSNRPRMIMTGEILCGNIAFPFLSYGDQWKRLRKAVADSLNTGAAKTYYPILQEEALLLVHSLVEGADQWSAHIDRAIASSVLRISYGVPPIKSTNDPLVTQINAFNHRIETSAQPGAHAVDIFPSLNYLPEWLAPWKRWGRAYHDQDSRMFLKLYHDSLRRKEAGECSPCVASLLTTKPEVTEQEASWLAGVLFGAGFSTTAAVLQVFILAMVLHPDVVRKAQAQLDDVVGRLSLPTIHDEDRLPYIRALIKETFRWRSIAPLGIPHAVSQDDEYEGYHIPKDSIVLFNDWAMKLDQAIFQDPDEFRPERYLDEALQTDVHPEFTHNKGHTTFGYGRRKCVGQHIAENTLFTTISILLWAFNIEKERNVDGGFVTPDRNDFHNHGVVIVPAPFPASFTPRFPGALDLVRAGIADFGSPDIDT